MLSAQSTERALLTNLLARLRTLDADVYVGHNISAFDLDVLLHRLQHHKVNLITDHQHHKVITEEAPRDSSCIASTGLTVPGSMGGCASLSRLSMFGMTCS